MGFQLTVYEVQTWNDQAASEHTTMKLQNWYSTPINYAFQHISSFFTFVLTSIQWTAERCRGNSNLDYWSRTSAKHLCMDGKGYGRRAMEVKAFRCEDERFFPIVLSSISDELNTTTKIFLLQVYHHLQSALTTTLLWYCRAGHNLI